MAFSEMFVHKKNPSLYFLVLVLFLLSAAVYTAYFDILLPGFSDGSYRKAVGEMFIIPSVLLAAGQIFFGGFLLHMCTSAIAKKGDFLRSLSIAAIMAFMFSLTYVMFPFYGPFYYIVFVLTGPWYALPLEIAYTAATVLASAYLIRRFYDIEWKISIFVAAVILGGMTVAAS